MTPAAVQNLVGIRPWGDSGQIDEIYLYLLMNNSPTVQTTLLIFTLDGSNDLDSCKDVPFRGFVDIAPH